MGLFNSSILLSENDVNSMEFTFLLRYVNSKEDDQEEDGQEETLNGGRSNSVEDDDNGFKTPTSLEHKIPTSLQCPMAPRKPKPRRLTKRKAVERHRLLLDLSSEIQSLFPAEFLVGLGGKIKRVRQ
ncbi:cyclin-dependent protein kinase inhibitor SMR3 [Cucumis sativus]|uniref:Cyclin-dependent protein kinase inhibitor SMR3 n=1 Tax=Cucumis sativus TaxID=3659 RepID=A0A0A0LY05_CUCSA|nr:cyclin-dependent protein kinase inhibitor SMR3 [Cucumis sativus]KGN65712.1 hypothetical protein Csa_019570 [Cucumis sativus]